MKRLLKIFFSFLAGYIVFQSTLFFTHIYALSVVAGTICVILIQPSLRKTTTFRKQISSKGDLDYDQLLEEAKQNKKLLYKAHSQLMDHQVRNEFLSIITTYTNILTSLNKEKKDIQLLHKLTMNYTPSLLSVTNNYIDVTTKQLSSEESQKFKKDFEHFIAEVDHAFKAILEQIYNNDILESSVEMTTLSNIFKAEGIDHEDDPFHLK